MLAVGLASALAVVTPAHAATATVVSLTFDDGQSSQYDALPILQSHGMTGTFYLNSAMVGSSGYYMGWPQIHDIAAAGNEIGGHTLHHVDLSTLDAATATKEICDDRANLVTQGYNPVSFAYPFASYTTGIEQTISSCGYTSARGVGGARIAETIPPRNPYVLRTPAPATSTTTVQDLENEVTAAENNGGGWVILTFHGTCEDLLCTGSNSTKLSTLTTFLDWLQARQANGTVVRTVGDVIGGSAPTPPPPPIPPTTYIQCNAANCQTSAYTAPVSVSFVVKDHNPSSVDTTYYTTDGSDPTTSSTRTTYTAPFQVTQTSTLRFYTSDSIGAVETPQSQTITIDTPAPPPTPPTTTISCNDAACGTSAYTSAVTVKLAATDPNAGATTTTYYTTDGSDPTTSATRAPYAGPFQLASTSTVKYYSTDSLGATEATKSQTVTVQPPAPQPTPPTTTISCNDAACGTGTYTSAVTVKLAATDPNAGATTTTYYTTDGSDPTTSGTRSTYAGPFQLKKTSTVKYYSTDSLGATEATRSQTVTVEIAPPPPPPAPPTTTITCNGSACSYAWYRAVTVELQATGTGTTTTYYTTDGSDPVTSATRSTYTGAFTLTRTSTVRYYSTDAGGASATQQAQHIRVDGVRPAARITSPKDGSRFGRGATVHLSAWAVDAGGSGLRRIVFYDGDRIVRTVPVHPGSTYRWTWKLRHAALGTHRLRILATDGAGNTCWSTVVKVRVHR